MSEFSHAANSGTSQVAGGQRWSTRKIAILALFTALSLIVSFIEVPIFPAAPFLKYDASAAVAALAACSFGPAAGLVVGIVSAAIHGLIMGDPWGSLMTVIVVVCWTLPIAIAYRLRPTRGGLLVGIVIGSVLALAGAIGGNLLITPIYTGTDMATVAAMIIPILLPFNAIKTVINDVLLFVLNTPVQKIAVRD